MLEMLLFPAAVAVLVFVALLLLVPKRISSEEDRRKKAMLDQMSLDADRRLAERQDINLLKDRNVLSGSMAKIPGVQSTYDLLLKAGMIEKSTGYMLCMGLLFVVAFVVLKRFGLLGMIGAGAIAFFLPRIYLNSRIKKRNEQFLNLFPDAIDMIVRSVKSGHPLNTAMRLIADNMDSPVKDEFKLAVDEVSYGRTLTDALLRMSRRIDEPDLNFFVVVLSVQQETGGSLAEVLSNLSGIIRKRRQLRLKIRALTSEGRATSYVLGSLPVIEYLAIHFITPSYLDPLWDTFLGNIFLGSAIILIIAAVWVVRIMVDIDV